MTAEEQAEMDHAKAQAVAFKKAAEINQRRIVILEQRCRDLVDKIHDLGGKP